LIKKKNILLKKSKLRQNGWDIHNFEGCLYRVKQINLRKLDSKLSEMEILAQPLCETVFTPHHFSSHKKVADQNFKPLPSHKKFHFKKSIIYFRWFKSYKFVNEALQPRFFAKKMTG
jgi:hypothetical protein